MKFVKTIAVVFILFLMACEPHKKTVIPKDPAKWDMDLKPSIEKLNDEDKKLLVGFLMRHKVAEAFGAEKSKDIITIGEAISSQKKWLEEMSKKDLEAKLLKDKLEGERLALQKQVDEILTVTVVQLKLIKERYSDKQLIKLGFENKSSKDIKGIKGEVKFLDIFDTEVGTVAFSYSDGLKAGATSTWNGTRDYNQFISEHRALANLEGKEYTIQFKADMIVFKDGSKLVLTEN